MFLIPILSRSPNEYYPILGRFMSHTTKNVMLEAGRTALSFSKSIVDLEHILLALLKDEIVCLLLDLLGVEAEKLRISIVTLSPKGKVTVFTQNPLMLSLSDAAMRIVGNALIVSRDYGSAMIEPEHLLITLFNVTKNMTGVILRANGITSRALKNPELRVLR